VVTEAGERNGSFQRLLVRDVSGSERVAMADCSCVGDTKVGDEVVVNTEALDRELGSGGFDIVHVNLTRGLEKQELKDANVMKLNYSSLQHAVLPVEENVEGDNNSRQIKQLTKLSAPVGVFFLHGQLAPTAFAIKQTNPELKVGYIQTHGGALPGGMSKVVKELLERELLFEHVTAGHCYGGAREAVTVAGALNFGLSEAGWDIALCGPGPGILGSGSRFGHGGMYALDNAHTALSLGADVVLVARASSGEQRQRHRGISHHSQTVLELLLQPVTVALPAQTGLKSLDNKHQWKTIEVDLAAYRDSGLPARTMGRSLIQDPLFFQTALAGGVVLGSIK